MPKPPRPWIVTPHGSIEKLEENLWAVEGAVPVPGGIRRRMSIIRLQDGRLLFYSAIPLAEPQLSEVLAWGKPAALVVGHDQHAIDGHAFCQKLNIQLYGPKACEAGLRKRQLPFAGGLDAVPVDSTVSVVAVRGSKSGEAAVLVRSGPRTSLLTSDVLQNSVAEGMAAPLRWLGFAGGPKVVFVYRKLFVSDLAAVKGQLEEWSKVPGMHRLIPCHGTVVDQDAAGAIARAAAALPV